MLDLSKVPLNEYGHVQTAAGNPVRLFALDRAGRDRPIVGVEMLPNGDEELTSWRADGSCPRITRTLIPAPRKVRVRGWINIYGGTLTDCVHRTRAAADEAQSCCDRRIACIEIDREVTEGEGI